jgi:nucleoside diphosphate kinase
VENNIYDECLNFLLENTQEKNVEKLSVQMAKMVKYDNYTVSTAYAHCKKRNLLTKLAIVLPIVAVIVAVSIIIFNVKGGNNAINSITDNTTSSEDDISNSKTTDNLISDSDIVTDLTAESPIHFTDVVYHDNYIKASVIGGVEGDKYDYYISTISDELWTNKVADRIADTTYSFMNLKTETKYYIGVVCYENGTAYKGQSNANSTTRKLLNLQHYEIYDREGGQARGKADYTEIVENTKNTINFRTKFYPNPDYLGRLDVNDNGVIDDIDLISLQESLLGIYTIPNQRTSYQYTWLKTGVTDTFYVTRGDINNDGTVDGDDVSKLSSILNSPDIGEVVFNLIRKTDYDADNYKGEYVVQKKILPTQSLSTETVINETFTGLQSGTEYVIMLFAEEQKHYESPYDLHYATVKTSE